MAATSYSWWMDTDRRASSGATARRRAGGRGTLLRVALQVAAVGAVVYFFIRERDLFVGFGDVLSSLDWYWVAIAFVAELASVPPLAEAQRMLLRAGGDGAGRRGDRRRRSRDDPAAAAVGGVRGLGRRGHPVPVSPVADPRAELDGDAPGTGRQPGGQAVQGLLRDGPLARARAPVDEALAGRLGVLGTQLVPGRGLPGTVVRGGRQPDPLGG